MHQFSRDAGVAEAWLLGQEPYLSSREVGQSVDEVEKLIKRHEAFEKSAATWEERFSALERLTTVREAELRGRKPRFCRDGRDDQMFVLQLELLEVRRQQEEMERRRRPPSPEQLHQEEVQQEKRWGRGRQTWQHNAVTQHNRTRCQCNKLTHCICQT